MPCCADVGGETDLRADFRAPGAEAEVPRQQPDTSDAGQETADPLVALAKAGDANAFEALVRAHYRLIYRVAYRWLGDPHDAEDVTQTVCMKLAQALAGYDGRSTFTTWLYRVTLNAVRDLQRAHQRRGRQIDEAAMIFRESVEAPQEDRLLINDVWRMVRGLPDKQRDAVLLVYGDSLSQAEAALVMNCKEVTVSWHIHNARKALRGLL